MAAKRAVLIVLQGQEPGSRYTLSENRVVTIGRASQNQISLVNPSVSRLHCEIAYINGQWRITDLNSKMGTFLNGDRITERRVLQPGDIIRVATNILRFDVGEKRAQEDDSALAIQGAVIDAELRAKGQAVASLEDIRRRSVIDIGEDDEEGRSRRRRLLMVNALLVGGAAAALALCVGGTVAYGYHRVHLRQAEQNRRSQEAWKRYSTALALVEQGPDRSAEAIRALRSLLDEYGDAPVAPEAARTLTNAQWDRAEAELKEISKLEAEGSYREAIAGYESLSGLVSDPALSELVTRRRDFALRLARSAWKQIEQEADRLLTQQRDADAARALYERAKQKLGVPSLLGDIEQKLNQVRGGKSTRPDDAESE